MSSYWTTHHASVQNHCSLIRNTFQLGESLRNESNAGLKKNNPNLFISALPYISEQDSNFLMRPNTSQPAISVSLPISQGCVCLSFVCWVLPGDIPVCSCYWNSTAGLCLFLSSNKEDSGVLTFTWMKGALHTKHFRTLSVNNIRLSNNQVSRLTPKYLAVWKIGIVNFLFFFLRGNPGDSQQRKSWEWGK